MAVELDSALVQLRKGVLEYCVLAQLRESASYGLKLASDLARYKTLFASEGTIYPLLARLRKKGLVETYWEESTSGPPRRYYSISQSGDLALTTFAAAWRPFIEEATRVLETKN